MSFLCLLLIFLAVRVYYRIKLVKLGEVIFCYSIIEKRFISIVRGIIIIFLIVLIINIYLRLVFRVRLEIFSFKISIYFLVLGFLFLRLLTNLNFKFVNYGKVESFIEV